MKKLILAIFGLLVIGVAGVGIYISSIDWNEHKDQLSSRFYEMTGKKIVFGGPVSLKFLPYPSLNATNVKILNPQGEQAKPLVEVTKLVAELSLKPLLSGSWEVRRMVLDSPKINVELLDDGKLNWQGAATEQPQPKAEISLNSVSLENATLTFEDAARDITLQLDDLSGEIVAQSLYGPYRVEGNYTKDNVPQGFAISVGKLSDSFATSLNLVLTHPASESYVRFDGSFLLQNKVLNGNIIFESKKLKDFAQANFPNIKFDDNYNYPLALTFDTAFNERQLNLSNIVVKYGDSQGAGNMQIPLNDGVFGTDEEGVKPRIDLAFNFTDFNLDPLVYAFKNQLDKYRKADSVYALNLPFDLLADVKSVRTQYNDQAVKNFETSFDVIENIVTINNISAVLPGDTDVKLKGSLSAYEEKPFYNLDVTFKSADILKTLNWAGINPQVSMASTYKKALGNAKFSGTLDKIQISPFAVTVDKSSLSGEAGIKLGKRPDMMLVLNADAINFDNYISTLPVEEKNKSWGERMAYRFSKLGMFNEFEMQLIVKMDLAIYENMPFEKVDFDAVLLNGKLDINKFNIASVANASVDIKGQVLGFGGRPNMENLAYDIKTENLSAFINKLELPAPDLDYKKLNRLSAQGVLSGELNHFAINSETKLDNLNLVYKGQVTYAEGTPKYEGDLEVRHADFVQMLETLNSPYFPQGQAMGLFNLVGKFNGTLDRFKLDVGEANIGYNQFKGLLNYEVVNGRPHLVTDMQINKFEIERFLNKDTSVKAPLNPERNDVVEFLANPNWDKTKINYAFYNKFDWNGRFNVQALSYYGHSLQNTMAEFSLFNHELQISDISGAVGSGMVGISGSWDMRENPQIALQLRVDNLDVSSLSWGGKIYGISRGGLTSKLNLKGSAESQDAFAKTLAGNGDLAFSNLSLKGWNLAANWEDIKQRDNSDGLAAVVKNNLMSGSSVFNTFQSGVTFDKGVMSLSNAVMKGNGAEVKAYGDADVAQWNMNMTFDVKYDEAKYLPGYSFNLKGPINAPLLDVNVSALFNLYKSRQDKIDNDAKMARDAEDNRLKLLIEEQKNIANNLVSQIRREIDENLNQKSQSVYDKETPYQYDTIRQKAGKAAADLVAEISSGQTAEASQERIDELKALNQQGIAELEKMKIDVKKAYLADVKKNINKLFAEIIGLANQSKKVTFDYNTSRESLESRLKDVVTSYQFAGDINMQGWDNFMKEKAAGFEPQNMSLLDDKKKIEASDDEKEVDTYRTELADLAEGLKTDLASMKETLSEMRDYAQEKVTAEEDLYNNKIRSQEVQRKVEENKGTISIKKSGRVVEVVRDIQDIEKAEGLIEDKEIKVLDFSKPKQKMPEPQNASGVNVVKKGRAKAI